MPKGDGNRGKGIASNWLRDHIQHEGEGCLIWPFSRRWNGYGQLGLGNGKMGYPHRVMCELVHGGASRASLEHHQARKRGCTQTMTERDPEHIEQAAKALAKWIGYAWDGLSEERIEDRGFLRPWSYSQVGGKNFQGGKQDLRDLARKIATLANGETDR